MSRFVKILAWFLAILITLFLALVIYVRQASKIEEPQISQSAEYVVTQPDTGLFRYGNNWFRRSESGLYELYVTGDAFSRGVAIGKLTTDLIQYQERVFNEQIRRLVPSSSYLNILKYFVGWFNRNLNAEVPEEYRYEIYGVSLAASHEFDDIAPPYQRILNYHAAHDIGHALQNMSLVGCTAFATWGSRSVDSTLIVGRNFDFYVGDDFAKNKIVAFYSPEKGYPFMMVTFGGMTGVLSGMNTTGLTVTINAAKSEIPQSSATPVSLVAREILQYAATIDEAFAIASRQKVFVAEAFLIASTADNEAAIIEKNPDGIDLYRSGAEYIIGTNHFQGDVLGKTPLNQEHMHDSPSVYRHQRVKELLDSVQVNSVTSTASILRNRKGLGGKELGLGHEKSINQLIAHHAVIFQPSRGLAWISTAPYQLGKFVCYDLKKVLGWNADKNTEIYEESLAIPADSFLLTDEFENAVKFNAYRFPFQPQDGFDPDSVIKWNPSSYLSYLLAGDFYMDKGDFSRAEKMYEEALTRETATVQERRHLEENLARCKQKN